MRDRIPAIAAFLIDIERLKLIERKAYVSDLSRRENSAEHSWHLCVGLVTVAHELGLRIDLHKALVMALVHDICEIDAGDTPAYGQARPDQHEAELKSLERLESHGVRFGVDVRELWLEYEAQTSLESRWVKVMDRLMPFLVNLATQGQNWKEQNISRAQVLSISEPIRAQAPEIYEWMRERIDVCVEEGWLRDE